MARYRDFIFKQGQYTRAEEFTDTSAIILAIRNILLARQGNYPFNPSFSFYNGESIEQFQFDLLDQEQIDQIKSILASRISEYIPDLSDIAISVEIVNDESGVVNDGRNMLGISISSKLNASPLVLNFLLYEINGELTIINEAV